MNLFELTHRVARELNETEQHTVDSGTTGTFVDTELDQANDYWNGGTVWILSADGSAPEGEYSVVTDWATGTSTVTLQNFVSAPLAAGDIYAIANKRYPLQRLIQFVNSAIADVGDIEITDTTLTGTSSQTEYTLPTTAANRDLAQVWMQTRTDDSNDNQWIQVPNPKVERTGIGSADTLILPYQPPVGYKIKLVYNAPQASLYAYNDSLSESIDPERIVWQACVYALRWRRRKVYGNKEDIERELQTFEARAELARIRYPARKAERFGDITYLGPEYDVYRQDEPNVVRV